MSYAQKDYHQKQGTDGVYSIAQIGDLPVALCNMMSACFNKEVDPASFNKLFARRELYLDGGDGVEDDLGWESITAFDGTMRVCQVGPAGAWPTAKASILKFKVGDRSTYAFMADPRTQTIVDSWDGEIKNAPGTLEGWAIYDWVVSEAVAPHPDALTPEPLAPTEVSYIHPAINIRYEALAEPKQMYVNKDGGCDKWAFGDVKKWDDVVSNGKVKQFENVVIVGIATVDLGEQQAGYYMDALAFGEYINTGNVKNTIGYAWADLSDGIYVPPEILVPEPAPVVMPEPEKELPTPEPEKPNLPNEYKKTWFPFKESELYRTTRQVQVQEFDGRGRDRVLAMGSKYEIAGTFVFKGNTYYRPDGARQAGRWYGIPIDAMRPVYDFPAIKLTIPDKQAIHQKLSMNEQVDVLIARTTAQIARFKAFRNKKLRR